MSSLARGLPVVLLVASSGCATPRFDRTLLVVDLASAPVPVMMSRVRRAPPPGTAPVVANDVAVPTHSADPDTIYTFGEGYMSERSSSGASEKLLAGISAGTGWVQIGAVIFSATDRSTVSSSEMHRELSLEAVGQP
jgi:hypothetical protein